MMDLVGILWGAGALATGGSVFALYRWEMAQTARTGKAPTAAEVAAHVETAVSAGLQRLPEMVSEELQKAKAEGQALLSRAQTAEAAFVHEHAASVARAQATGAAIMKALTDLGDMGADEAAALAAQFAPQMERFFAMMSDDFNAALQKLVAAAETHGSAGNQAAVDAAVAAKDAEATAAVNAAADQLAPPAA